MIQLKMFGMRIIGLIISILLLISLSSSGQRYANKEAIVIIVAGQSNANGSASSINNISQKLSEKSKSCKIWNGSDFVYIFAKDSNNNQFPTSSKNGNFSFNIPLLSNIFDSTQQNVYLINYAAGGTKMYDDGSNQVWCATKTTGLYGSFRTWAKNAISAINLIEDNYTVKFYFYQGETDCQNQTWANAYETNLNLFIDSVRTQLNMPNLDTYIMRIHANSSPTYIALSTVRTAQSNVCSSKTNCTLISVDDCELGADLQHLTSGGHVTLANKLSGLIQKKKLIIYKR